MKTLFKDYAFYRKIAILLGSLFFVACIYIPIWTKHNIDPYGLAPFALLSFLIPYLIFSSIIYLIFRKVNKTSPIIEFIYYALVALLPIIISIYLLYLRR